MKKTLLITLVCLTFTAQAETKKVCHDKVIKGKTISVCKQVKIHQAIADAVTIPVKKK